MDLLCFFGGEVLAKVFFPYDFWCGRLAIMLIKLEGRVFFPTNFCLYGRVLVMCIFLFFFNVKTHAT